MNIQEAAIFDLDGTLALLNRGPYEWDKVEQDNVNHPVNHLRAIMRGHGYKILIFTARPDACHKETKRWLEINNVIYDELHMRKEGDMRPDYLVKKDFYDTCKDRYRIVYAIDDRPRVCRLWHKLGLCLIKVGDPDADF